MADKLRNVRISVVNKDSQSSDPVNVITSAESVILDGTNVNIKDYVDDKVRNVPSTPLTDVASGKVVGELREELTGLSNKLDTLPETVSASVNSEEIVALRNKVSDMTASFSTIALKDNLSMTKDEAGHLRTKMDETTAKIAAIEEQYVPATRNVIGTDDFPQNFVYNKKKKHNIKNVLNFSFAFLLLISSLPKFVIENRLLPTFSRGFIFGFAFTCAVVAKYVRAQSARFI